MHEYQFTLHENRTDQDAVESEEIEGKFGTFSRCFGLYRVMTKLAETSESANATTFLLRISLKKQF